MTDVTPEQLREAASDKIIRTRRAILAERREIKQNQNALAERDRALERQFAECEAAAKFFGITFQDPISEKIITELEMRVRVVRNRMAHVEAGSIEAENLSRTLLSCEADLRRALRQQAADEQAELEFANNERAINFKEIQAAVKGVATAVTDFLQPKEPRKTPKIREVVLEQLRLAGPAGQKAAPIQKYIESTYSTQLHDKTVGMTLYRLSKDNRVHRQGQTWFYGPQAGQLPTASTENPGASTPGPTHVAK